jgi:hypothetical protein
MLQKWTAKKASVAKHSQIVKSACPSLRLNESFEGAFFFELDVLRLKELLLSTAAVPAPARQGKHAFGRSPPLWFSATVPSPPTLFGGSSDLEADLESLRWTVEAFTFLEPSILNADSERFGETSVPPAGN